VDTIAYTDAGSATANAAIIGISLSGGAMYIANANATDAYQLIRCVNIGAPEAFITWVGVQGTTNVASSAQFSNAGTNLPPGSTSVTYNDTGHFNLIYQIIGGTANGTAVNGYPFQIKKFTDTMVAGPHISSPAADEQVPTAFNVTWGSLPSGGEAVTYQVQIATDSHFSNMVVNVNKSSTSHYVAAGTLVQGTTYYLRVAANTPYPSPNSDTVKFMVKLGQTGNNSLTGPTGQSISPGPGAENVPVNATFQWAAVTGAESYHIQVADNPGFTSPIADATTQETFFSLSSPLDPGMVYYWRIQAISGSIASDYVSNVFTTATEAAAPTVTSSAPATTVVPTYTLTVPPSDTAPSSTPAYIWVIIVIGAILVIAVIVLIARTRRV